MSQFPSMAFALTVSTRLEKLPVISKDWCITYRKEIANPRWKVISNFQSPSTTLRPWHIFCSSQMHETYSEVPIGKDTLDHFEQFFQGPQFQLEYHTGWVSMRYSTEPYWRSTHRFGLVWYRYIFFYFFYFEDFFKVYGSSIMI